MPDAGGTAPAAIPSGLAPVGLARVGPAPSGPVAERSGRAPPVPAHPLYEPAADEVVWNGRFPLQRVRFRYRRGDGRLSGELTWELWRRNGGVIILPWDPRTGRIALIRQFRLPALAAGIDPLQTECPAGLLEPDEDPLAAARRELEEETGLHCDRLEPFGRFLLMPGGCDEMLQFHLARVDLHAAAAGRRGGLDSEHEETELVVIPTEDAFAMVADNRIQGAPAALAILWLQANHARLRTEWA
ncbi:NUDIX domain-containing protein [Roseomonas sp. BN140053]|uniref:NUDIX domain-containing protein n=1 Tax=Roseomonas sp. BN140053 TaxID=3391898 RepID=UPI0039E9FC4A